MVIYGSENVGFLGNIYTCLAMYEQIIVSRAARCHQICQMLVIISSISYLLKCVTWTLCLTVDTPKHWRRRIVIMPILLSMAAPQVVVIMTTCGVTGDGKAGIIMILGFRWIRNIPTTWRPRLAIGKQMGSNQYFYTSMANEKKSTKRMSNNSESHTKVFLQQFGNVDLRNFEWLNTHFSQC